ncbi:valine--tRNA (Val) ligase [Parastagonospora nodorum]|uniref:Valine--tRNA ligase, mitochondrial n=1 Tax=Phaeosphaeria nodorum (strain SN15 / ATCC MYA-4574 / FGSC 10173) TaxID=321614 RepID=A0A7U2F4A8_PHANO|nr:valine--tRNA (Val) ligase [Parastagonospora nodorum]QRC98455.1 valine--tRNA (Val) ligase [Parastagonospora nodorum SN15]KAH3936622.1 valine--tRNA (Val) ligase [Parastagonospora nodorum]KAH3968774.1 valine--tRNA (Val) ligase [Parastagonospora nodorum]KAH3989599.1 valine--tRNA (Val) ligase [Parastagonospora nodorum]
MALNASSHNVAGEKTGPSTAAPPAVSDDVKKDLLDAANTDAVGQSAPGRENEKGVEKKEKSAKELEKERKKAEKDAKFKAKKAAAAGAPKEGGAPKEKKKKGKEEEQLPEYVEETPKGEKKRLQSLDGPFTKAYIPKVVESAWYDWWDKEGFFKPDMPNGNVKNAGHFVIPIPPPNVTGKLHCGHALATSLQDVLIRWHRMRGYTTLYLPGCDHAGIATQSVVEKMLARREGKTRHDLGRQKFIERTMDWKSEYHQHLTHTLKRMGGSFDWTREAFTMDKNLSKAVTESFVKMHEDGLIYRSNRLVNWCTQLNTALSTLEVDNKDIAGRTLLSVPGYERKVEFGVLTHFKYAIEGTDKFIEVATTRPETMLGDSGIAVHPKDERYKDVVGLQARHPFVDRLMPIVADEYVDPEFGTGAVKLTPAHDANDFNLGKKHNLAFINILNDNGTMNKNTGSFEGQKRFDVRYSIVTALEEKGLFVKKEDNPMKVPICSRSGDVIEPIMKPQWWMKMEGLAKPAIEVVKSGELKIKPVTSEKVYMHWMNNIQDWCLSRQLWWGHQIPAYFVNIEGGTEDRSDNDTWVTGRTEEEAQKKAEQKFPGKKFTLERDEDVLDTWFSSGLWPFSTLGWPEKTVDFEKLFPTSVLETGWDILFFWVARMIMMSLHLTGKVPFTEVYCHSLIRDSEGRKMSKSLGNVIDPVDIMDGITLEKLHDQLKIGNLDPKELKSAEKYQKTSFPQGIPECGADALRMSLVGYTTGGGDISFDVNVIHGYRRFCNKIYQATKYVLGRFGDLTPRAKIAKSGKESLPERWILHKLTTSAKKINQHLDAREFSLATQVAYKYFYEFLCDTYIENSKAIFDEGSEEQKESAKQTLYTAIEGGLTMIHPFMPFLTEELWQRLPRREGDKTPSITVASFPEYTQEFDDAAAEDEYELLVDSAKGLRSLTAEYAFKEGAKTYIQALDNKAQGTLSTSTSLPSIKSLAGKTVAEITILSPSDPAPTGCAVYTIGSAATAYLDVKGRIEIDKEITKAQDRLVKANETIQRQKKIMDDEWEQKVSDVVKDLEKSKLKDAETEARNWQASIEQFERLKLE